MQYKFELWHVGLPVVFAVVLFLAAITVAIIADGISHNDVKTITVDRINGHFVLDTDCNVYSVFSGADAVRLETGNTYLVEIEPYRYLNMIPLISEMTPAIKTVLYPAPC
jgi:hypothetical protein